MYRITIRPVLDHAVTADISAIVPTALALGTPTSTTAQTTQPDPALIHEARGRRGGGSGEGDWRRLVVGSTPRRPIKHLMSASPASSVQSAGGCLHYSS